MAARLTGIAQSTGRLVGRRATPTSRCGCLGGTAPPWEQVPQPGLGSSRCLLELPAMHKTSNSTAWSDRRNALIDAQLRDRIEVLNHEADVIIKDDEHR